MATTWPQVAAWRKDIREHATYLSDYLRKIHVCIDSTENQPVPKPLVNTMIAAMSVLIAKFQTTPDVSAVMQATTTIQKRPQNDGRHSKLHSNENHAEYNHAPADCHTEPGDKSRSEGSRRDQEDDDRTPVGDK
ncbi:hypothetical protein BJ878DRAFT_94487 [Calycina marina]|uniref:Uncharacterized protein n=1 Tax=Calycina marina TaxID=1763456 RepID=A0A9P8CEF0_9HELO|nr:hypothetical protein BJ878DRAFT_94487 [Calycina marina]